MRILHVIGGVAPRYGGPSAALPALCRAVMDRGHHVEVFTTDIDGPGRLPLPTGRPMVWQGVPTTVFPVRRPRAYAPAPALGLALRRVQAFDVVHIHSLYRFHTLAAAFWCRRRGVPYVLRPHGSLNPYHRATRRTLKAVYELLVERRNLDHAAAVHCTSQAEADAVKSLGMRAPVVVVPLPVEVARYARPAAPARSLTPPGARRLVTFLGRIAPKKGVDVLVDAFARIAPTFPDVALAIAGPDGGHLPEVVARVQVHSLVERVHILGHVAGEEKVTLLQASTVLALPSLDENFALSVAEALAAGTPVVVSPGVALHREIAAAGAGLVAPRTAEGVARALDRLLARPELAARCGTNGRALAVRLFAPERVGEQLEALYRQVATGTAGAERI